MKAAGVCSSVRPIAQVARKIKLEAFVWPPAVSTFPHRLGHDSKSFQNVYVASRREGRPRRTVHERNADTCYGEKKRTSLRRKGTEGNSGRAGEAFAALEALARSDGTETSYPTCQVGGRLTFSTTPDPAVREERLRPWTGSGILVEAAAAVTGSGHVGVAKREARQGRTKLG